MSDMKKFDAAIIGGDRRNACMAAVFAEKKYRVITYGVSEALKDPCIYPAETLKEALESSSVLIFGIPFQKNGKIFFQADVPCVSLTELKRFIRKGQKVFAGVIPEDFRTHCQKREIDCFDFMQDEAVTIYNAIATAEGAILEALLKKDTNLHHGRCLVLGYGRCARVLSNKLKGMDARVCVCCRDQKQMAFADSMGLDTFPLSRLPKRISDFEYIFNTVPAVILTKNCLKRLGPSALIIDIASDPGGVDDKAAGELGICVRHCPGLPGKYACLSSAERLAKYVFDTGRVL